MDKLKVLILGSGYAGRGHTEAFRFVDSEVVGIVARTASVVKKVAEELSIPYAGTNWKEALEECQPDIVAIGTPGGAHFEPIMEAIDFGCHVYCDKPLVETAERAKIIYEKAKEKGIKTAFAASYRFMPAVLFAKELVAEGKIGEPQEAESISHFNLDPLIPLGWSHKIDQGGGRLNNNFTHLLSIMTHVIGENILKIEGEVRNDMPKAPIVEGIHNFATRRDFIPDPKDPNLEWGDVDAEWSYTVQAKLVSEFPAAKPVSVLFQHGGLHPRFNEDYIAFYGSKAAIYIKGHYAGGPLYICEKASEWKEMKIPQRIMDSLPAIEDDTQRNWTHLAQLFVDDILGKGSESYQSFKEGSEYQEIIEKIRSNEV